MKLFKFYPCEKENSQCFSMIVVDPNDYCRMYVLARDKDHVSEMYGILFEKYFKMEYSEWIDPDGEDEQYYIKQKRERFLEGLSKVGEVPDGISIDAHY